MLKVFEISRMTNHNGPGIRTLVHFKGCPLRCLWCSTPESQKSEEELFRKTFRCIGCGTCETVCPQKAITMSPETIKPIIDRKKCNECFVCVSECCTHSLQKIGENRSVDWLYNEICKDEVFFKGSGGGVTFSGGEPLMHVDEDYVELYRRLWEKGISIGVDTTGFVPWENIEKILPYTDFFLWDLKVMNTDLHKKFTGVGNELILENLKKVEEQAEKFGTTVYIRCVQIPGMTDFDDNLRETCKFLSGMKCIKEIDLVNFHHLGAKRYEALDRPYAMEGTEPLTKDILAKKQELVESFGIPCKMNY